MKRDKWSRKHWCTGNLELLDYLAQDNSVKDPLQILIEKEQEDEKEHITDRFSWDDLAEILSPKDESIIWDYYYEGLTLQQIAKKHGYKTPSAVWKRKKQALQDIREHYERQDT